MARTPKLESAAFTVEERNVTRHASGSRTQFRFTAPAIAVDAIQAIGETKVT